MATKIKQADFDRVDGMTLSELAEILGTTSEALQESYGRPEVAVEEAVAAVKRRVSSGDIIVE